MVVSAVKKSEDSDKNIIRVYETDGKDTSVGLRLFDTEINVRLTPNAVKTFTQDGEEVNFIEW